MSENLSIADVLERAADLIEPEGAWTQGVKFRDAQGTPIFDLDRTDKIACYCVIGALAAVSGFQDGLPKGVAFLKNFLGVEPAYWNDHLNRQQGTVVRKLREAAALAREQGK